MFFEIGIAVAGSYVLYNLMHLNNGKKEDASMPRKAKIQAECKSIILANLDNHLLKHMLRKYWARSNEAEPSQLFMLDNEADSLAHICAEIIDQNIDYHDGETDELSEAVIKWNDLKTKDNLALLANLKRGDWFFAKSKHDYTRALIFVQFRHNGVEAIDPFDGRFAYIRITDEFGIINNETAKKVMSEYSLTHGQSA